jgi:hypothetical protein
MNLRNLKLQEEMKFASKGEFEYLNVISSLSMLGRLESVLRFVRILLELSKSAESLWEVVGIEMMWRGIEVLA